MHTMIKSNDHIVLLLRPEPSANSQIPLHLMSVESSMPSESTSRAYSTRTSHLLSLATSAGKYPAPGHTLISCRSIHGPRDPSVPVCTAFHEHKLIKLACLLINLFTHHAWAWRLRDIKNLRPTANRVLFYSREIWDKDAVFAGHTYAYTVQCCDGQTTSPSAAICAQNMRALAALPLVSYLLGGIPQPPINQMIN